MENGLTRVEYFYERAARVAVPLIEELNTLKEQELQDVFMSMMLLIAVNLEWIGDSSLGEKKWNKDIKKVFAPKIYDLVRAHSKNEWLPLVRPLWVKRVDKKISQKDPDFIKDIVVLYLSVLGVSLAVSNGIDKSLKACGKSFVDDYKFLTHPFRAPWTLIPTRIIHLMDSFFIPKGS